MREDHLIRRVKALIEMYSFVQPFSIYLKDYFRKHPEMGARDRRETREWCFNFFRIGSNLSDLTFERRLAVACFLCSDVKSQSLLFLLKMHSDLPESEIGKSVENKIGVVKTIHPSFLLENIFPMHRLLAEQIRRKEWYLSFLKKPKVWIRIRKGYNEIIINELNEKNISYSIDIDPFILSFEPNVSLEKTIAYQKGFFEIQDKSSQHTRKFFQAGPEEYWWDACAGSGGKSLLLKEEDPKIKIFATDVRSGILKNYSERLKKCGYDLFETEVMDLTSPASSSFSKKFDGIIADVPCTGSGTWARSPEWIQKDPEDRIKQHFVKQQRSIVKNIFQSLKVGSPLIYITCSVFREENEENIRFFIEHLSLKLEKYAFIEGYTAGADTLFVARLIKIS